MSTQIPYDINKANAVYLLAILNGEELLPDRTNEDLVFLIRNTLLLAKNLADNCKEWLTVTAIIGNMHPHSAEKLNCPTLEGALHAALSIPRVGECKGMCHTCAFRVGSPANQTEATAEDIAGCLEDGELFMCHDFDDPDDMKPCRGFCEAFRNQRKKGQ